MNILQEAVRTAFETSKRERVRKVAAKPSTRTERTLAPKDSATTPLSDDANHHGSPRGQPSASSKRSAEGDPIPSRSLAVPATLQPFAISTPLPTHGTSTSVRPPITAIAAPRSGRERLQLNTVLDSPLKVIAPSSSSSPTPDSATSKSVPNVFVHDHSEVMPGTLPTPTVRLHAPRSTSLRSDIPSPAAPLSRSGSQTSSITSSTSAPLSRVSAPRPVEGKKAEAPLPPLPLESLESSAPWSGYPGPVGQSVQQ